MSKPSRSISDGDMHHLVERRRDQAGQADDVDLLVLRRLQDLGGRHHDAEVDDLVIVAGQHDADDVLADVVDVALDRRHQDLAGGLAFAIVDAIRGIGDLLRLHVRQQPGDGLLHDPRRLHHLRQEHLAGAEQVADDIHAGHQAGLR